jgi:hypothetical protein
MALIDCASRKCFEYSKQFEKECLYKVTYVNYLFLERAGNQGTSTGTRELSIEHDPAIPP